MKSITANRVEKGTFRKDSERPGCNISLPVPAHEHGRLRRKSSPPDLAGTFLHWVPRGRRWSLSQRQRGGPSESLDREARNSSVNQLHPTSSHFQPRHITCSRLTVLKIVLETFLQLGTPTQKSIMVEVLCWKSEEEAPELLPQRDPGALLKGNHILRPQFERH